MQASLPSVLESSIDQGPYINVDEDGMVAAVGNEQTNCAVEDAAKDKALPPPSEAYIDEAAAAVPVKVWISRFSRRRSISVVLLAYIAIVTTWPLVGPALLLAIKRKFKKLVPSMPSRQ